MRDFGQDFPRRDVECRFRGWGVGWERIGKGEAWAYGDVLLMIWELRLLKRVVLMVFAKWEEGCFDMSGKEGCLMLRWGWVDDQWFRVMVMQWPEHLQPSLEPPSIPTMPPHSLAFLKLSKSKKFLYNPFPRRPPNPSPIYPPLSRSRNSHALPWPYSRTPGTGIKHHIDNIRFSEYRHIDVVANLEGGFEGFEEREVSRGVYLGLMMGSRGRRWMDRTLEAIKKGTMIRKLRGNCMFLDVVYPPLIANGKRKPLLSIAAIKKLSSYVCAWPQSDIFADLRPYDQHSPPIVFKRTLPEVKAPCSVTASPCTPLTLTIACFLDPTSHSITAKIIFNHTISQLDAGMVWQESLHLSNISLHLSENSLRFLECAGSSKLGLSVGFQAATTENHKSGVSGRPWGKFWGFLRYGKVTVGCVEFVQKHSIPQLPTLTDRDPMARRAPLSPTTRRRKQYISSCPLRSTFRGYNLHQTHAPTMLPHLADLIATLRRSNEELSLINRVKSMTVDARSPQKQDRGHGAVVLVYCEGGGWGVVIQSGETDTLVEASRRLEGEVQERLEETIGRKVSTVGVYAARQANAGVHGSSVGT
ncbi:uncharacterized protein BDR25DRAFT_355506 [Lindgomyces ingoldianus]|uniref:Uncharacterized protein n=1 Tax=Lindgomyces ingoldianus TaxID=673940 RepID=A0ACB6QTR3_9PLEO|nr:uncharacterized protein BDR25DRAFT_355506 [Lindgomyces ingoldianus]KAF2470394.1 hypothetical protein BDR25DRAFT_355506 [Lindgomyces ingoldianus]